MLSSYRFLFMRIRNLLHTVITIALKKVRWLLIGSTLVVLPQQYLYTQPQYNPKSIVISKDDVKMLGGWPIERRWYGIAIQRLRETGVKRVFLDIAFPSSDILHPESDEFFFQHLERMPDSYLLFNHIQSDAEKYIILGSKHLSSNRFVAPFSTGFSVIDSRLEFVKGTGTIVDYFLPPQFSFEKSFS